MNNFYYINLYKIIFIITNIYLKLLCLLLLKL